MVGETQLEQLFNGLARIEAKLDALINAMAEDEPELPTSLDDGRPVAGERDQTQSLG